MAGGPHADVVPCMVCLDERALTPAVRVREGYESDQYRCERGHTFGLDFPEPADEPQWPPPPELVAYVEGAEG